MTTVVIHGEGLGKSYHRGALQQSTLLRDQLSRVLRSPLSVFRRPKDETFWALKDVSLEVREGEVLGLIGRNGAGKTTLLKILSRITKPTTGWAEIHGRVGSLLEVGTGFHPELTGRENTYLSGAILGMGKSEIRRKFDEIVAFAEIERFIDTPVKHYSSGMFVRLAFAVAAHLEPEILFVDEVLAVGDAAFQKKCLKKMGDVSKQGRTVVFVSHNMIATKSLCDRVVWLDEGSVLQDGPAEPTISAYLGRSAKPSSQCFWPDPKDAPGNDIVRIRKISIHLDCEKAAVGDSDVGAITVRTPVVMRFEYWNLHPGAALSLSLHIYDGAGTRAFATFPLHEPLWNGRGFPAGLFCSSCHIPADLLNAGTYRVQLLVVRDQAFEVFNMEDAFVFEVQEARFESVKWYGNIPGVVRPALKWNTELVQTSDLEPNLPFSATSAERRRDS
jgi:lipopolysaccharide transport system ATP-binding protein